MNNHIETISELRDQFTHAQNVNKLHKSRLSSVDKLALFITEKVGTMGFFMLLILWVVVWLLWNLFAPVHLRFDPFPAFVLLLFITNILGILLMPLIMVGQNIQGKHAELRSEYDYTTDRKSEKEIEVILKRLERQESILEKQHEHIHELLEKIVQLEKKK